MGDIEKLNPPPGTHPQTRPSAQQPVNDGVAVDAETIEGGEITSPPSSEPQPIQFSEARHRADTARYLAYALVGILGGSFILHYIVMTAAAFNGSDKVADRMSTLFGAWFPVISSLVGGAVTYYFTREGGPTKGG